MSNRIVVLLFLSGLLSFTSCKRVSTPREKLMGGIKNYEEPDNKHEEPVAASDSHEENIRSGGTQGNELERPVILKNRSEYILERVAYTTSYNKDWKIPNWVAWELTADEITGPYKRAGIKFQEDMDVPFPRAVDWDYARSGYDRGHMCPSGDNKWDRVAQEQTFLFTNICPQNHQLNKGDWNELEEKCRMWAAQYGRIYIVTGPIVDPERRKTIGRNKVVVPSAFFKVVLKLEDSPEALGFIYENAKGNNPISHYLYTVDDVEKRTGIDFFVSLPDDVEERVESVSDLNNW